MADDEPRNSSCTASSATSDGGSSTPPSPPSPAAVSAAPPLSLVAVPAPPPPPFAPVVPASIATAVPLPQQQLLQQYQQQFQQQQRLLSLQLSSTAASSPPATGTASTPLKHPLLPPPSTAAHHADHPAPNPPLAFGSAPSDRHSRDDCWSEGATITLIHAWGDRYLELNRGNLKQKHWKDVADCVNRRAEGSKAHKTDIQCKNRLDTLKKKYKLEKSKIITGGGPSKWAFFDRLDELIGPSKKPKKPMPSVKLRPSLPLMPAPLLVASIKHEAEQLPQLPPPSLPPISNHCASPVANHVAPNHHIGSAADTVSKSKESRDMTDSCPNADATEGKGLKRKRTHDDPMKELAQAIVNFGEIYERIEISKQQKMVELEKQRMIFTKDLELQRLQFFMQTQLELAKLKHSSKHGNADNCS